MGTSEIIDPIKNMYLTILKYKAHLIQKEKYIYVKELGHKPQLEFVIEKGYIRNAMI